MTLDEAIEYEKESLQHCKRMLEEIYEDNLENKILKFEVKQHDQLAEWLELLKWYEQGMEDIPCESGVLPKDVYWAGYNKALDDIVTIIKERVGMDWEWDFCFIEQIAEQLKAGVNNEDKI